MFKHRLIIMMFLLLVQWGLGQTAGKPRLISIKNAESLSYDREKTSAKILRGNVICEHEGTLLYCDTAFLYEESNRIEAAGHILITKGDSIRVTGNKLFYDGKTRLATLQGNVKCVERDMTLTTPVLTFDVANSVANYYNGGTLVNKQNTLVSKNGHYYSATKEATFHYDVVLTNPEYKMNSDTLRYRISNKTSYFLGPSIILSKNDYIFCENGWYDTEKERAQFSKNALLVTAQQKLRGDSLFYDRKTHTGRAYRNVSLIDTSQKSVIYGDFIEYRELKSEALVTKKALYARLVEADTLFMAADTLYHRDLDSVNNFLNAYHHVRIYKKDLQARCDSATLDTKDSLIQLFKEPVLWSNRSQGTARQMKINLGKNEITGFELDGRAFFIQQVDSLNAERFNQLAGKTLKGFISNDTLRKAIVNGNAEIVYYPKNKDKTMGLNKTQASEIVMWFKRGEADRVTMRPKTSGGIDPIREANPAEAELKGFNWMYGERPKSRFELHTSPSKKTNTKPN